MSDTHDFVYYGLILIGTITVLGASAGISIFTATLEFETPTSCDDISLSTFTTCASDFLGEISSLFYVNSELQPLNIALFTPLGLTLIYIGLKLIPGVG